MLKEKEAEITQKENFIRGLKNDMKDIAAIEARKLNDRVHQKNLEIRSSIEVDAEKKYSKILKEKDAKIKALLDEKNELAKNVEKENKDDIEKAILEKSEIKTNAFIEAYKNKEEALQDEIVTNLNKVLKEKDKTIKKLEKNESTQIEKNLKENIVIITQQQHVYAREGLSCFLFSLVKDLDNSRMIWNNLGYSIQFYNFQE